MSIDNWMIMNKWDLKFQMFQIVGLLLIYFGRSNIKDTYKDFSLNFKQIEKGLRIFSSVN